MKFYSIFKVFVVVTILYGCGLFGLEDEEQTQTDEASPTDTTPTDTTPTVWNGIKQFGTTQDEIGWGIETDGSENIYIHLDCCIQ